MALDVNRFRADGLFEVREPVGEVIADLNVIQGLAAVWHAARKRLATWGAVLLIAGVLSFFLYFPAGAILFAVGIWLLFRMKAYPRAVANHEGWCSFAKSVTAILEADGDPKAPVAMRLAFNAPENTISQGPSRGRSGGTERIYKLAWFSVDAMLLDGTSFSQTVEDMVRRRDYRSRSGKSKVKTRARSIIGMRFDYPAETYGDISPLGTKLKTEIRMPQSTVLRGVEVSAKAVKLKAVVLEPGKSGLVAEASSSMALGVYRILNLSRNKRGASR